MADLAVDDQNGRSLDESQIGAALFLPANKQAAEPVEPAMADLDHPPPGRMAIGVVGRRPWMIFG